jgi:hypothetical protein
LGSFVIVTHQGVGVKLHKVCGKILKREVTLAANSLMLFIILAMTILTAKIANVCFPVEGGFIEGLMDETGEFYVGVPQFCRAFSLSTAHASRDFKRLLGQDLSLTRLKTPLNSNPVNGIPVAYLQPLIFELSLKGNRHAIGCGRSLMQLSVIQLFKDAFDVPFGKDERQALLAAWYPVREKCKFAHTSFCESCKRHRFQGNVVHDYMTTLIFGDTAAAARLKAIVDGSLDPEIGLNHQEDVVKLDQLATAKRNFAMLKKKGESWQSKVERACEAAMR